MSQIKRKCKYCKEEYLTYPSINLFFCSKDCMYKWRKGKTWHEIFENSKKMIEERKGKRYSIDTEFKKGWQYTERGKEIIKKRTVKLGKELSKVEQQAIRLFEDYKIPFDFVGDGKLIVGSKNPDFIYRNNGKKIIEIYSDYWHRKDICKYWHQTEEGAILYYEVFGYNCLVIWEKELKEDPKKVVSKIRKFIDTTLEIDIPKSIKKRFLEILNGEFEGNYGMLLKKLVEVYDGFYPTGHEEIEAKLDILANEIAEMSKEIDALKQKPKEPTGRKMVNGKRIGDKK